MSSPLDKAVESFRAAAAEAFDSESEFLDTVTALFRTHAAPLVTAKKPRAKKGAAKATEATAVPDGGEDAKPKRRRNVNAYNIFVRDLMTSDEEIKATPAEQRMVAIGARWQKVSKDPVALEPYRKKAEEENEKRHQEDDA